MRLAEQEESSNLQPRMARIFTDVDGTAWSVGKEILIAKEQRSSDGNDAFGFARCNYWQLSATIRDYLQGVLAAKM